jgi:hypothetical protein
MATPKISTNPAAQIKRLPQLNQETSNILAAGLEALEMLNFGVAVTKNRRVLFMNRPR